METDEDKARMHVFGKTVLSGVFLGYEQQEGGGWSGDLCILDWDEIESAQHFSDMHIKRSKSSGVLAVQDVAKFRFPLAEGILRQPGTDRHKEPRLRRPRSSSDRADPVEIDQYPGEKIEKGEDRSEDGVEPASESAVDPAPAPPADPGFWS